MAGRRVLRQVTAGVAVVAILLTNSSEGGLLFPARAQAQDSTPRAKLLRVRIANNKSQTVRLDYPFTDVLVGSAEIADVIPLSDQTLYVLGKRTGTTNVSVLDSTRRVIGVVDVEVGPDAGSVAEKISVGAGANGIKVRSNGDQLVLEGTAADAVTVDRAVEIARAMSPGGVINATRVASPQQVMLKVRFVEVNRNAGRDLGIRSDYLGQTRAARTGHRDVIPSANGGIGGITSLLGATVPFATVLARFANNSRLLDITIDALEQKGLIRRLAEPNLVAMSGGTATFHAGGKIPVPVVQPGTGSNNTASITVQWEPFGVRLNFTPTVLANGLINLDLAPEVSDIDQSIGVSSGGVFVPGITVRSARTTVELRDGQSFAMAGLLQNITERNIDQLPWLGSVPVLGALFRSTEFRSRETELVVIVTPFLVKPGKPGDLMATPLDTTLPSNDADLFLAGKLEVEKPRDPSTASPTQEWVLANGEKISGPYGHILTPSEAAPVVPTRAATSKTKVIRAKN